MLTFSNSIFHFLRYINPVWYFNLKPQIDHGYFPMPGHVEGLVTPDNGYESEKSKEIDFAWNAFQSGYIPIDSKAGLDVWRESKLPLNDEYRFIRKNFNPLWGIYVLGIRILTFHNPLYEVKAYFRSRTVQRLVHSSKPFEYPDYRDFKSELVASQPLISIVIPTLNRYNFLADVFRDLEKQNYRNFEVIVVDQSEPFREELYRDWKFPLRYWYQQEKALWKARNEAIKASRGEFILLYDDDSLIEEDWISQHLKALDFFHGDLSSGVSVSAVGDSVPAHYSFFRWSDQLDTGNVLLRKDVFRKIGLFDRQFEKQRMGDGEFGLRAYLAGFRNISNPYAKRMHLKVSEGGLRQMGSWDGWRPKNWWSPRPIPSILYYFRSYFGTKRTLQLITNSLIPSLVSYKWKSNRKMIVWVILIFPIIFPVVLCQVVVSWHLATRKIKLGPLVDKLESS
jgi:glycosyltransferase involved in cell wall biosynthesis